MVVVHPWAGDWNSILNPSPPTRLGGQVGGAGYGGLRWIRMRLGSLGLALTLLDTRIIGRICESTAWVLCKGDSAIAM